MTQKALKVAPKPTVVATKLTLPTTVNQPSDDLLSYYITIFGRKGIGKSTFGASYPDALSFMLERGRRNLSISMVPKQGEPSLTFKTFTEYFTLFCKSDDLRVGVLDTIDALFDMTHAFYLEDYGYSGDYKGLCEAGESFNFWASIKSYLEERIQQAQDAGKVLVFISHEKLKEKPNADGTMLERIEPTCGKACFDIVQRYCDFVFHYDWVANDRVLTIRSTDNLVWTSCGRNEMFCDPDGTQLKRIKIPSDDPEAGFETLEKAFQGELRDLDYPPPKPPKKSSFGPKKTSPATKAGTSSKK